MTRKKPHNLQAAPTTEKQQEAAIQPQQQTPFLHKKIGKILPYLLTFICLWFFCTFTYGDVFTRTVQESFIASDSELMKHLTDVENGQLYLYGRYLLLIFHNQWGGGLILSLLLTLTTFLLDYAFKVPRWLQGLSAIIPFSFLLHCINQGLNIYYKNEPSLFVLQATGIFLVAAILSLLSRTFLNKRTQQKDNNSLTGWRRWSLGSILVVSTFVPFNLFTLHAEENTILTARMQNHILSNDIFELIEDGQKADQPTRSVAAYYAIGLVQSNQILEHVFDISYHFPDIHLQTNDNSGEYGIFTADCNFFAGLINSSYRSAMDQIVMNGPRLYYLKRIALCAILNQEKELANKYLNIISKVPFENDFVETYQPMVEHPELITQDPVLAKVMELYPMEHRFEQNYRNPAFLGYNVGMLQGSNAALAPSMAACMYSKDLPNLALRAVQYKQMTGNIPLSVQEALSIHGRKNPEIYRFFPELNDNNQTFPNPAITNVNNFYLSIQKHFREKYGESNDWRSKMGEELKNGITEDLRQLIYTDWKGHYVYYYYCENIRTKQEVKQESSGVN